MKILFSLNNKFFKKNPYDLINYIKKNDVNNVIYGFEFYIDFTHEEERKYLVDFAYLCKEYNYYLQLHGINFEMDIQKKYFELCNQISNIMGYSMNIVIHSLDIEDIDEAIKKTSIYFKDMFSYIEKQDYDLKLSIENLNSPNVSRLSKDYLNDILVDNEKLGFTYDVGHEIMDYGHLIDLDEILLQRIKNVHIHTYDMSTFLITSDHQPIGINNYSRKWIKAINYLKYIKYDGPLVLEYDLYKLGENIDEQLDNYMKCAIYMKEYL